MERRLFDDRPVTLRPVARAAGGDPPTSMAAALDVERSGAADTQRRRCLAAVIRWPGLTSAELARRMGIDRHAAARRLPELREGALVWSGQSRRCRVMGRQSLTWWPGGGEGAKKGAECGRCGTRRPPEDRRDAR